MTETSIPLPEMLKATYLENMRMRNLSPRTLGHWEYTVRRFNQWFAEREITCVTEVTRDVMEACRSHLYHYRNPKSGRSIQFGTQLKYLNSFIRWFRWLTKEKIVDEDPTTEFELPKEERRLPTRSLTADEVESVLNAVDVTAWSLRSPTALRAA